VFLIEHYHDKIFSQEINLLITLIVANLTMKFMLQVFDISIFFYIISVALAISGEWGMFKKGQAVKPVFVDEAEERFFFFLKSDITYHVLEYNPTDECAKRWPEKTWYQEHGGRVVIEEMPTAEWFRDRFVPTGEPEKQDR